MIDADMTNVSKNKLFFGLIIFGVLIRVVFIFIPGFQIDINDWFAWSIRLSNFNFAQFYSKDVFTDYTPGYLYILSLLGFFKNLFALPDSIFYLLLKIPAIIADLTIGIVLYQEMKRYSEKIAILTFCAILLNPVMIFNSTVWGQIDSILALLMLITIIVLQKNNLILSSISFGLAILVKPQAIALIPLLIIFLISHFNWSNLFKITIPGLLIVFLLSFPFFPNQTLINLMQHIINASNEYPYTSVNAYNLWGIVGFWLRDNHLWNNVSYQTWGYILLALYWIVIGYFYFKRKLSLYAVAALATLGFFFIPTRVHERYLYPAIVFLILLTVMYRSKLLLVLTGTLSMLHLLNLYYVYVYYNEFYLKLPKILYNPTIYNFLDANSKGLSLLSTTIFILISAVIIKYYAPSKKD